MQQMVNNLPTHLSSSQKQNVASLLEDYEDIFSRGEYDIEKTDYVEYRIDTGSHHPIRQPIRRHPFKHLEEIDQQVEANMGVARGRAGGQVPPPPDQRMTKNFFHPFSLKGP